METKLAKYEIRAVLARSAMSTVYEGWDAGIARRVALKTVQLPHARDEEAQESIARFRREARAAGRLQHPNIVAIYDYGETEELAYIAMEFIDGHSLSALLDAKEGLQIQDVLRIMEDVLAGLDYSHARGVVHRDIKPSNIMITREGRAKIADFGIARVESSSMTQVGTVLGTPAYMSPEQLRGEPADARSDIYSLGVVLYQMLAGKRPFDGSLATIIHKALHTEPPRPSQISMQSPPRFDEVVATAMAKAPEKRYANTARFAEALWAAYDPTIVMAPKPAPISAMREPRSSRALLHHSKRSWVMTGVAVALAILGTAGAWFAIYGSRARPVASSPVPGASVEALQPQPRQDVLPAVPEAPPSAIANEGTPGAAGAASGEAARSAEDTSAHPVIDQPAVPPPKAEPVAIPTAIPPPPIASPTRDAADAPPPTAPPRARPPAKLPSAVIIPDSQLPPEIMPRRQIAPAPEAPRQQTAPAAGQPAPAQKDTTTLLREFRSSSGRSSDTTLKDTPAKVPRKGEPVASPNQQDGRQTPERDRDVPGQPLSPATTDGAFGYFAPDEGGARVFSPTKVAPLPTPAPADTRPPANSERQPATAADSPRDASDDNVYGYFRVGPDGTRHFVPR